MTSGDTLKASESAGVGHSSGLVERRWRIMSMVSGDSFLGGFQPSLNFFCRAAFCDCHNSGLCFFFGEDFSFSSGLFPLNVLILPPSAAVFLCDVAVLCVCFLGSFGNISSTKSSASAALLLLLPLPSSLGVIGTYWPLLDVVVNDRLDGARKGIVLSRGCARNG